MIDRCSGVPGWRRATAVASVLAIVLAGAQGCGGSRAGGASAVKASGTVTYKGAPLEKGFIQFVPENGRPAEGKIENGKFTMSTYDEGDGAIPGTHAVAVTSTKEVPAKQRGQEPTQASVIPEKYATPQLSDLTVTIPPEGKTDITIELK